MKWLLNRLREPSTMASVPLIAYGVDSLFGTGAGEAAQVGAVLQDAVPQLLSGNWVGGTVSLVFGLGALFLSERGAVPQPPVRHALGRSDPLDPYGRGDGDSLY